MTISLGERGRDALRELFNVGAGAAATGLSQMLGGERVLVDVPDVDLVATTEVGSALGDAQRVVCAVGFTISGGMDARLLLVLEESSARRLAATLLGRPLPEDHERFHGFDAASRSALEETGNIVASYFVSGLGKLTNRMIMPSVPSSGFDSAAVALDSVLGLLGPVGEQSIVCRTDYTTRGTRVRGHLLLLPEQGSLEELLTALGVDPAT